MRTTEHNAKTTPSAETGFFAVPVDLRRVRGIGAPSAARCLALRVVLAATAALVLVFVLAATPALAAETHLFETSFNGLLEAPEPLVAPWSLAVDNSSNLETEGDVYVGDNVGDIRNGFGNGVIDRFDATGKWHPFSVELSRITSAPTWALAVDPSTGDLYASGGVVEKFEPSGKLDKSFGTEGVVSAANIPAGQIKGQFQALGVAVDPSTGDVYVGDGEFARVTDNVIDVFNSKGEYQRQFPVASQEGPFSLAIDSRGNLFVRMASRIEVYVVATGKLNTAYGECGGLLAAGSGENGLAVDPSNDDLYIDEGSYVDEYENGTCKQISSFGSGHVGEGGIGIGKANHHVYVSWSPYVAVFGPLVPLAEATTEAASELTPTSATLNGTVNPSGLPLTECIFEYGETEAYGHTASCETEPPGKPIGSGTAPVKVHAKVALSLPPGPGVHAHFRLLAPDANGPAVGSADQPIRYVFPSAETEAIHALNLENIILFGTVNSYGVDTHYHFEYVAEAQFDQAGWAEAVSTPEKDAGTGGERVSGELLGPKPGETYRWRITAENSVAPGHPESSPEGTLKVPVPGRTASGAEESQPSPCPNEALRTGPSARLPDCRAYEQVTPVEKGGAQDLFPPEALLEPESVIGSDGEHFLISNASAKFGEDVGSNSVNIYSFSRSPAGWQMTSASPQPQTGIVGYSFLQESFGPGLSPLLFQGVRAGSRASEEALVVGPAGGPYTVAASVPASEHSTTEWLIESRNGAVAVLVSGERELIPGRPTPTTTGRDLYEFSAGRLRQLNVDSEGKTIGICGAHPVRGAENAGQGSSNTGAHWIGAEFPPASINAVSADGSRVFFAGNCTGHLYMRVGGAETVDIGAYGFVGANPEGTRLILSRGSEYFLYATGAHTFEPLPKLNGRSPILVSEDGNVIYLGGGSGISRYDIAGETLTFIANSAGEGEEGTGGYYTSPDGAQFYWESPGVEGVPGGRETQFYRYDSAEETIQCVSCASPFDPAPKLLSITLERANVSRVSPLASPASANGDYVFFETPSALVPRDVNGEILHPPSISRHNSPSMDVYEWRHNGIDGCAHIQGCLALITNGIDGTNNTLLGTDPSGRDVFFWTHSQLVPQDKDTSADVYDARIGGGYPPPPARPTECEGDACSTPFAPPNDLTPSSATFQGAGNVLAAALPEVKPKPKPKKKPKKKRIKSKKKAKSKKSAKKAGNKRRVRS